MGQVDRVAMARKIGVLRNDSDTHAKVLESLAKVQSDHSKLIMDNGGEVARLREKLLLMVDAMVTMEDWVRNIESTLFKLQLEQRNTLRSRIARWFRRD